MRFAVLVSVAALSASAAASPAKRQAACATECGFEQKFCTFRESPDCAVVCTASEYNKWVACHSCQIEAGNAEEADAMKTAIARLAAGCNSSGNTFVGGPTSALTTATAAPKPAAPSAPAGAAVDAASPSPNASDPAAAPSSGAAAGSAAASGSGAAPSASAPAASTPASGAMGRAAPVAAAVAAGALALLA